MNRDFRDIVAALTDAGARFLIVGAHALDVSRDDLMRPDIVVQLGVPPYRVDLLTGLSGLEFDDAWDRRIIAPFEDVDAPFLSREDLVRNKRETGRHRDLADLESLGEL